MRHSATFIAALAAAAAVMATAPALAAPAGNNGQPATAARRALVLSSDRPATDTASGPGCVSFVTLGPRATVPGPFKTLSRATPAATRPARVPSTVTRTVAPATTYTVTVTGTNIAGQPTDGPYDRVFLFNADDSAQFDNPITSVKGFTDGVATFRVPAGHYWAVGDFTKLLPKQQSWDEYLDVLPQFPVSENTTVHLAAAAATSEVGAVVPRPVTEQYSTFQLIRSAAAGPPVSLGWLLAGGGPKEPAPSLYIGPTSASPTVGKLATVTSLQLGSGVVPSDSRYLYDLAYQSAGTIASQQHVVNQAALATVHLRSFSAAESAGVSGTFPAFPVNSRVCSLGGAIFGDMRFPAQQTVYLSASPALSWQTQYIQNTAQDYSGGQVGPVQAFVPGEHQTQDFGAYPLHPAANVRLSDIAGLPPVQVSASRSADTLRLAMTAFSDSVPGHLGQGTFPPVKTAASYEIEQNGTKIAGGTVPSFYGAFAATARLSPSPSIIQFTLDASESATLNPLSVASQTVWTWRSAHDAGATLPAGWTCLPGGVADRSCDVQPMMTLRYNVVGMGLNGSVSPGQQVVDVLAGHLELARAAKVTAAAVSVSFDGGKTWRAARVTGNDGSYAAVFSAPPGARVTLRTSAADAVGGSITETITNAYQVAS
jgi:hypothetical protein